jgi:phage I-like protein
MSDNEFANMIDGAVHYHDAPTTKLLGDEARRARDSEVALLARAEAAERELADLRTRYVERDKFDKCTEATVQLEAKVASLIEGALLAAEASGNQIRKLEARITAAMAIPADEIKGVDAFNDEYCIGRNDMRNDIRDKLEGK